MYLYTLNQYDFRTQKLKINHRNHVINQQGVVYSFHNSYDASFAHTHRHTQIVLESVTHIAIHISIKNNIQISVVYPSISLPLDQVVRL